MKIPFAAGRGSTGRLRMVFFNNGSGRTVYLMPAVCSGVIDLGLVEKMEEKTERLNKYLAACGVCSRREADRLIEEGRVTVDGKIASMGIKVSGREHIMVNGKSVAGKEEKAVLAYYKPAGVVCTERDRHAERKISDELKYRVRLTYAGRLDKDSEGLLMMTNDGALIDAMMRGANRHEKEYVVKVDKEVTEEFIRGMAQGVYLEELDLTTRKCEVRKNGTYTFTIVLTQGVNRQIRRMVESFGYRVRALKRVRVMNINLVNLKPGEYRVIQGEELRQLYVQAGLSEGADGNENAGSTRKRCRNDGAVKSKSRNTPDRKAGNNRKEWKR